MRILTISNYFPPFEKGGYEQLCRDVCARLVARGHQLVILTSDHSVRGGTRSAESGVVRRLKLQIQPGLSPGIQFFLARAGRERHNLAVLQGLAASFQPDVVFCWNLENLGAGLARAAAQLPGVGVAHWLAGRAPTEPDLYEQYWTTPGHRRWTTALKWLGRRPALYALRARDPRAGLRLVHVGVVSRYWRDRLVREGFVEESAEIIHNGVELELFAPLDRPKPARAPLRLLQAGRLDPGKGAHTALEALAVLVNESRLDVRLTLAGGGPSDYRRYLHRLVEHHELENHVRFTGWLPREQMPALLAEHDSLLLPTITPEPLARVALEGMAAGLVVVGTITGGMGELLEEGVTGLTFAPQDAAGLARAVARLAADPALRRRLAAAALAHVRTEYGLDRMVERCEHLLARAQQAARGRKAVEG